MSTRSLLLAALLLPAALYAGSVTLPNTFTNGSVADADQVNANFTAIKTAVDDNDARLSAIQSSTPASDCGLTEATAATSCLAILDTCLTRRSQAYWLDPDGDGADAFQAFCDMDHHGGGWTLIGKLGEGVATAAPKTFDSDVSTAELVNRINPGGANFPRFDLARFDAYGSNWTVRTQVDSHGNGNHYQFTLWRPATGETVLPSTAGMSWQGTDTGSRMVWLANTTTSAHSNATWAPWPGWDIPGATYLFSYRVGTSTGQIVDGNGQTITASHCPAGSLNDGLTSGTHTACFGINDGVAHAHGKRAFYWIRATTEAGTLPW